MSQVEANRCRNSTRCLERDRNICYVLQFVLQASLIYVISMIEAAWFIRLFDAESNLCRRGILMQCDGPIWTFSGVSQQHTLAILVLMVDGSSLREWSRRSCRFFSDSIHECK
jgi:hypothetical protein